MNNVDIYKDARRKLNSLASLYFTVVEQERVHPELMKGFAASNHELLYIAVRACRTLDFYLKVHSQIEQLGISQEILQNITNQQDILCDFIALFVGSEVVSEFIMEYDTNG